MHRLRIINTNVIPSDHLLDVEGLPPEFVKRLPQQPKSNWINKSKPEFMIDYKTNDWDELERLMNRYAHGGKIPKPACLVDSSEDRERARILPRTLQDEDVPVLVLDTPESMRQEVSEAPTQPSFNCPECDFEGKSAADVEGHLTAEHGVNVAQRAQEGKPILGGKRSFLCDEEGCEFVAESEHKLRGHKVGAHRRRVKEAV